MDGKLTLSLIVLCAVISSATNASGQSGDYSIPVTTDLNIEQTIVEIRASKDHEGLFREIIKDRFSRAGLTLPGDLRKVSGEEVVLRFTQHQTLLDPICPKKVFYIAQRQLIEPVTIVRNNEQIIAGHWDVSGEREVRAPVPLKELESSLGVQLDAVLYNYQLGKQASALLKPADDSQKGAGKEALQPRQVQSVKLAPSYDLASNDVFTVTEEEMWGSLRGLSMDNVYFDQLDKSYPEFKPTRDQLLKAELVPHVFHSEIKDPKRAARLNLTMEVQSLNGMCPGKVLYKLRFALHERVIIERNGLRTWADTWGSYRVQIRPPLAQKELDEDQLQLVNRFIHEYQLANPKR
jgi:hypothetical protein